MNKNLLIAAALTSGRLHALPARTRTIPAHLADAAAEFEETLATFVTVLDPVLARVHANIEKHGLHLTGVFPADSPAPAEHEWYTYTTGLGARLGFELALATLPFEVAGPILHHAATLLTATPSEGDLVEGLLGSGYTARLHRCTDTRRFATTRRIYGSDPVDGVWQIVVPDADGRFPDEPGYNHDGLPQPLY
ncbi:DUF4262 domain-containing protein [Kitasatospora sp. NPDC001540]|uniref:DUF4262 domain-containing protein n=1 Tax=Kitasatospora sp. NPDC001540 TaxID=3364014 RepID=UPI0036ADA551